MFQSLAIYSLQFDLTTSYTPGITSALKHSLLIWVPKPWNLMNSVCTSLHVTDICQNTYIDQKHLNLCSNYFIVFLTFHNAPKGTTEDKMAGWHHRLDGHEFEWTPGVGDGQGGLACCDSWGHKESDTTERLKWTELNELLNKNLQMTTDVWTAKWCFMSLFY